MPNDLEKHLKTLEQHKEAVESKVTEKLATADEKTKAFIVEEVEKINESIEALKASIEESKTLHIPGLDGELKKKEFSFCKFINAATDMKKNGTPPDLAYEKAAAGFEKDVLQNHKGYVAGTGAGGGYLIPSEVANSIIDLTMPKMPIINKFNIATYRDLVGELHLPILNTRGSGFSWLGETESMGENTGTIGEVVLRNKQAAAYSIVSNLLMRQTGGRAEELVRRNLTNGAAIHLHQALINGSGSSAQPKGVLNGEIGTLLGQATNGSRFKTDKFAAMQMFLDVLDELEDSSAMGLLLRPEGLWGMRRERVEQYSGQALGDGQPLSPEFVLQSVAKLEQDLGMPIATTTQLPKNLTQGTSSTCSQAVLGNWNEFYVGFQGGMEMMVSEHMSDASGNSVFLRNQMAIRLVFGVDAQVGRQSAFVETSDVETLESAW